MSATKLKMYLLHPTRPERVCWGCARLCPASDMACGDGKDRTEHPSELFGEDWYDAPFAAARSEAGRDRGEALAASGEERAASNRSAG